MLLISVEIGAAAGVPCSCRSICLFDVWMLNEVRLYGCASQMEIYLDLFIRYLVDLIMRGSLDLRFAGLC